ncbi:unnamed protein product (mitochondrion) [Plasmodiophora brassicae]|uniref:Signal recognition particle 9 kDa protein n=1 Tax=Plasmodiophora brassicae TaxID=37360 RepID=A0A0G4J4C2_PLABS|nr:hypothetical protein PBRA_002464 [Plasmodiophora brassicae]SPQ93615.1 unnamed protein product [Plasmodiophora brassicae]
MVYYTDWPTFASAVKQLYAERPNDTRYCIKYRHKAGSLVLKVTDDRQCLKYRTQMQPDVKKVEHLSKDFIALMSAPAVDGAGVRSSQ